MYRIQTLDSSGWIDREPKTTAMEACRAADPCSPHDALLSSLLNPVEGMVFLMSQDGSSMGQNDYTVVA